MHIIKLDAIDSTNSYLRRLSATDTLEDYTVVVANVQTKGRGQMGTVWQAQPLKNLMCSVFVDVSFLEIEENFFISMAASLAISKTLKQFQLQQLNVKWPNDILAGHKKISGILIENVIKNNHLQGTIIGIGLNVNQVQFPNLPNATSMLVQSGRTYPIDEVLQRILESLRFEIERLKQGEFAHVKNDYQSALFRNNKPSTFKDGSGQLFSGYIKGVTNTGHLKVLVEDEQIREFQLKEVELIY